MTALALLGARVFDGAQIRAGRAVVIDGAAIAGVVATTAGLGDASEPTAVGHAVSAVYLFCWIPFGLNAILMIRFLRVTLPRPAPVTATAE